MDPAKTTCDMILTCWKDTAKYRKYIRSLGDNLAGLKSKMVELDGAYKDVKRLVERAEGEGWIRKDDPARWLTKVEDLKQEVDRILADGKLMMGKSCLCGLCFINCRARYKLSELAEAKRADLETELAQGRNNFRVLDDVAYEPADLILERSLRALEEKSAKLRGVFKTVRIRVKREEEGHMVRTPDVGGWLKRVEDLLEKEVEEILEQGKVEMEKVSCHGAGDDSQTQRNVQSFHGISKRADEKVAMMEEKILEGRGFVVFTYKPDDPLVVEMPIERPVGAESTFKEVWGWVEDETVKCIGLHGMGGIGKTHLLDRVHNQFLQITNDYDFALRIVVSRPVNLSKIQEAILEKSKLKEDVWKHLERIERVPLVRSFMQDKNFLLFLDDLWDPIDLQQDVGIPCNGNPKKYKIMFTTREERVCNGMKADRTKKVECLPPNEALQLFRQNLGEKTWSAHPWIPGIATRLVHECKYLPLAIRTVARAMVGTMEPNLWVDAENDLKNRLNNFQDMEKRVLVRLEFSYNRLPDETHKICFLYLSMFPEDYEIHKREVIDLWIGEGFLDECENVRDACNKGEKIFRKLKDACLVEFARWLPPFGETVKMHDVVRKMALWVYSEHGLKKKRVLVQDGLKSFRLEELNKWKDAERISLWRMEGELLDSLALTSYSHLSTLIIRDADLTKSGEIFLSMPCLKVLDLSSLRQFSLPNSLWNLTNLRYLKITMASLIRTEYLPVEIKNLNKLEVLILSSTIRLPVEAMSNLSSLRVFRCVYKLQWFTVWFRRPQEMYFGDYEIKLLDALQKMQSMEEISVIIVSNEGVEKLLSSHELHSHLRELLLLKCDTLESFRISTSLMRKMDNLRSLTLSQCKVGQIETSCKDECLEGSSGRHSYWESHAPKPSRLSSLYGFHSLSEVFIHRCRWLVDVTPLIYHAPVLEALHIASCDSLEEVIVGDIDNDQVTDNRLFPCLRYLNLVNLKRLRSICRRALPFPSLERMEIVTCPKLKMLPLNHDSAMNSLRVSKGARTWWECLQWNDPALEQIFSAKFQSSDKI